MRSGAVVVPVLLCGAPAPAQTLTLRHTFRPHVPDLHYRVNAVAFTPDGKTLVTGTEDGTVGLTEAACRLPGTSVHLLRPRPVSLAPGPR